MNKNHNEKLEVVVVKNASLSFTGSIVTVILKLAISLVVTRTLGPGLFGIYVLAAAILGLGVLIALFGIENSLVKHVSQYKALKDESSLRGTLFYGIGLTAVMSVAICMGLILSSSFLSQNLFKKPDLLDAIKFMALAVPFSCFGRVTLASLQGFKLVKYKVYVQQIIIPSARLLLVLLSAFMNAGINGVIFAFVISEFIGAAFSCFFLLRNVPELAHLTPFEIHAKNIIIFSLPLFFAAFFKIIMDQADTLIIGFFLSKEAVGIYGITKRIIPSITFSLAAFNNIFAPIISDLYASKKMRELNTLFKTVARWIFSSSLPIFIFLVFFAKPILSIFGKSFIEGYWVMIILCFGQFINSATGSVGFMLMMTGRPAVNAINSALLCLVSIILNLILVPRYGIMGAAFSGLTSISVIQILRVIEVWYFLKVHPYRTDFIKPVISALASILVLQGLLHLIFKNQLHVTMLPVLFCIFFIGYGFFIWLLKLSQEDYFILNSIKRKFISTN
jgi:O-antigen/teichoic acid export membrane protein